MYAILDFEMFIENEDGWTGGSEIIHPVRWDGLGGLELGARLIS